MHHSTVDCFCFLLFGVKQKEYTSFLRRVALCLTVAINYDGPITEQIIYDSL